MTSQTVLYRIESFFDRIEIESYRKVFTTCRSKIESNRNQFDLTAQEDGYLISTGGKKQIRASGFSHQQLLHRRRKGRLHQRSEVNRRFPGGLIRVLLRPNLRAERTAQQLLQTDSSEVQILPVVREHAVQRLRDGEVV